MSTTTQAPPAVEYDADRSTTWTEVFNATSRSQPGQVWRVTFEERGRGWFCPCPARVECAHIRAAKAEQQIRWWRALWADAPLGTLVYREAQIHEYLTAYPDGDDAQDKRWELSALGDLVGDLTRTQEAA